MEWHLLMKNWAQMKPNLGHSDQCIFSQMKLFGLKSHPLFKLQSDQLASAKDHIISRKGLLSAFSEKLKYFPRILTTNCFVCIYYLYQFIILFSTVDINSLFNAFVKAVKNVWIFKLTKKTLNLKDCSIRKKLWLVVRLRNNAH